MGRKTKRNVLYTPEVWADVLQENKDLIDEYVNYLESTDHAETTIDQYRYDLQQVFCYVCLNMNNKHFVDITKRDWLKWQNTALTKYSWSSNRLNRVKSTVASLEKYIVAFCDDIWPNYRPIIRQIPSPVKQLVREKSVFTEDDIQKLLDILVSNKQYEKATLVALATYSGRRKSELPRFKMDYFNDEAVICNSLYKTPPIKTKGRGKNGKLLNCYVIKKKFDPYLELWRKYREENNIQSEWLLYDPKNPSNPLPVTTIDSWANQFTRLLNCGREWYPHAMRHLWATSLSEAGLPVQIIQKITGWESGDMCILYIDTNIDDELSSYFNNGEIVAKEKKSLNDL